MSYNPNVILCGCGEVYELYGISERNHMVWELRRDGTVSNLGNCPKESGNSIYSLVRWIALHGMSGRAWYRGREIYAHSDGHVYEVGKFGEKYAVTTDTPVVYSLSDCKNYSTNERGDCGGRLEQVDEFTILCENCRNRNA